MKDYDMIGVQGTIDWSEFSDWYTCLAFDHATVAGSSFAGAAATPSSRPCRSCMQRLKTLGSAWSNPAFRHAYAQFAAGAIGGGLATYSTHWLDTIKVKMQTFPNLYHNGFFCLKDTMRQEGLRGLYQGAAPAVVGSTVRAAVVFMCYGLCEDVVKKLAHLNSADELSIWHHACAGAATGVVASVVLCPLEIIKCRLQAMAQLPGHSPGESCMKQLSPMAMLRDIIRNEGVPGLFRGLTGMWAKDIPGSFVYFGSYEFSRYMLKLLERSETLGHTEVFASGVIAGLCFCIMHPFDAVKTRVQVMSALSETKGFFRPFWIILRTEGIASLYSGMKPYMLRAGVYSGIQFMAYEHMKGFILSHMEEDTEEEPD